MIKYLQKKMPVRRVFCQRSPIRQLIIAKIIATTTFCCSTGWMVLFAAGQAQALPNPPLLNTPQPEEPQVLPELPAVIPQLEQLPTATPLSPERVPGTIVVKRFEIINNQVLPPEEIERVVKPYLFRQLSFIELLEVQEALTKLYVERGYITTGAFIPAQTIEDRVIKVKIIPGKIEEMKIVGLNRLHEQYIRSRLEVATKSPLNQDKLLNALQLLQLNPLIANITAELSTGINPGGSFLQIEIEEAETFEVELGLDNWRSPSIGSFRRQIKVRENNLFGWGDRFEIVYANSEGSNSLENLTYALPVNAYGGEIRLTHNSAKSEIITEPFAKLDIDNNTSRYAATYLQPLFQSATRDIAVGVSFTQESSTATLNDLPVQISTGADTKGEIRVSALRFFQEFSVRSENQVFAVRSQFSIGIDAFNASISQELPDSKFFVWQGQAQYLRLFTPKTSIFLRSDLQLAGDSLTAIEQFTAGGGLSVRGYAQDVLVADNGIFLSAELRHNLLNPLNQDVNLELIPFIDFSRVWNLQRTEKLIDNTLFSVGIGLQLAVKDRFTARLDWGIPVFKLDDTGDSLAEKGIHFFLEATLF